MNNEIDFSKEYHEARKMMGKRDTDLDKLLKGVCYVYVYATGIWATAYEVLIKEIEMRMIYNDTGLFVNTFGEAL